MDIACPYHINGAGRTAEAAYEQHIRDLVEQVLFTSPGERVNRPTFGCGLMQLIFAPNSNDLGAATQLLIQGALQQWLGDLIVVETVEVETEDANLRVSVRYVVGNTQRRTVAEFVHRGAAG